VKKRKAKIIKDKKLRGEWAESVFMARASEQELPVSKPWGDSNSYDFVVGTPGRFVSVQVKSTIYKAETGYECTVRGANKEYRPGSFDFLAAYVIPENVWYIIPAKLIAGKECIMLYPKSKTVKYEDYREAWHLLREAAEIHEETQKVEDSCAAEAGKTFPASGMERMQAAMNHVRRYMEGTYLRPQRKKDDEETGRRHVRR
jgi:hypothetical protein